ncbi:MAG TPA: Gfo/Idh/MocA family oxidoreductase [Acidimicrobiales bacterium]
MTEVGRRGAVVVGTGFGCLTHVRALQAAGFDVQGLVGRNPDRTRERAGRFGIPHPSTSLAEVLTIPGVEVVSVATPPHTHAELVLEAVSAGRHVVCEKPFARDADEARSMLGPAEAAGVVHLLGTEFRFSTGQALLTRTVRNGSIGDPVLATFALELPLLADPTGELPVWWSDAGQGGGWLGAHGSHVIDQIRVTLGEFSGVSATLANVAPRPMTAEDSYVVHFRLASGTEGIMASSAAAWGPPLMATRIVGTKGTAWLEGDVVWTGNGRGAELVPVPHDLVNAPPDPPPADLMVTAYDRMHATGIDLAPYTRLFQALDARLSGQPLPDDPAPATFTDGLASMVVMDAIRSSARNHTWVDIDGAQSAGGQERAEPVDVSRP